jgi:hypothetical protein
VNGCGLRLVPLSNPSVLGQLDLFFRIADGEPSTYSFGRGDPFLASCMHMIAYRNVNPVDPFVDLGSSRFLTVAYVRAAFVAAALALSASACGDEAGSAITLEGNTYRLGPAVVTQDLDQGLRVLTVMNVDDTCAGVADNQFTPLQPGDELLILQRWNLVAEGRNALPAVDAKISLVRDTGTTLLRTYSSGLGTPGDFIDVMPVPPEGEEITLRLTFHTKFVGQDSTPLAEPTVFEATLFAEYCPPLQQI